MIFLAQADAASLVRQAYAISFTITNVIQIITTILIIGGIYWKLKNRTDNNAAEIHEFKELFETRSAEHSKAFNEFKDKTEKKIEDFDRYGSQKFQDFREHYEKLIQQNSEKFEKMDELDRKVDKMGVQIDAIAKWVEKQQDKGN